MNNMCYYEDKMEGLHLHKIYHNKEPLYHGLKVFLSSCAALRQLKPLDLAK